MRSEDLTRALRGILITALVGTAVVGLLGIWYDDHPALVVGVVGVLSMPGLWWMVARGYSTLASLCLLGIFNSLTVYALLYGGGIQDPTTMLFPVMIIASGIMLDRRLAFGASVVLVLSCVGVGLAELNGLVETRLSHMISTSDVVYLTLLLLVVTSLVYVLSRALRESVQRVFVTDQSYREIFNATSEGIIVHDGDTGEIVDVNDSALSMFGYSREENEDFDLTSLIGAGDEFSLAALEARLHDAGRSPSSFEWCVPHRSGDPVWVDVTLRAAIVRGHARIVSVLRDTSERRVLQEQVQQAEKLRAVGLLARGVAHDFNNQLTGILANASLLEADLDPGSKQAEYTAEIIECSRRSAELTRQLLAFARKGQRHEDFVDIDGLVEDVKLFLERSIDKRITIIHDRSQHPAIVRGDLTFLQSALLNLGLNARDAMPDGGTLRFVVEASEGRSSMPGSGPNGSINVRVEDTGCGMAKEELDHIFEPFYTTKEEGNGMGLAAVYGTIEGHNGTISVESELGRGTTFAITLPASSQQLPSSQAPGAPVSETRFDGLRVLLAEDEAQVATVATEMLKRLGCKVTHCVDGAEALATIQGGADLFDIALLDHSMPNMTGAEVLQAIREQGLELPVISTSGYTEANDSPPEHQANAFLPKPFRLSTIVNALREALPDR